MKGDDLKLFLNKTIGIFCKDKYYYQGIIKKVTDDSVHFEDRKLGLMLIDIENIVRIEVKGNGSK